MNARLIVVSSSVLVAATALAATQVAEMRVTAVEVDAMQAHDAGAGTSGVAGIRTTVVMGDPTKSGPYTIRLSVPANINMGNPHVAVLVSKSR